MTHYKLSAAKKQAGMTLIELTVVLMILIGLAGLLIPYVAGFVGRTHDSSGADSIQEVAKALAGYDAKYGGYPGDLDRLVLADGSATTTFLMNNAIATATTPTTDNTQSLFRGGITTLRGVCDGDPVGLAAGGIGTADADADCVVFNPTFDYYDSSSDMVIAGNGNTGIGGVAPAAPGATSALPVITPADAQTVCGITNATQDDDGDGNNDFIYVVLGVGPESDMTGRTIQSSPVHFAQIGAMNATNRYNRFVAIFKVDNDLQVGSTNGADAATLACTGMAMMALEGPQQAIERFYTRQQNEG